MSHGADTELTASSPIRFVTTAWSARYASVSAASGVNR